MTHALVLAFLSGFVALSYEILWYRAYSFVSGGAAPSFALLLALYLAGIAIGARASRRFCSGEEPGRLSLALGRFILLSNLLGYLFVPLLSWVVTWNDVTWTRTVPLVAVVSCGLGAILPLVSHQAVAPDARAGARVSWIYFANILGSTLGSLLTGFWLTDRWSLRQISLFLGILGAVMGAVALQAGIRDRRLIPRILSAAAVAGLAVILNPWIFDGLYERLVHKAFYEPSFRFRHVVENRSGVITVYPDGTFLGGGRYDGSVNTSMETDRNGVSRAYAVSALHPRPREILMVGLSTGSWAQAVADNPDVERLTVIEINSGYLDLLRKFPEVSGVLDHPKVRIEIDDARRWMVRHRDRKFDVVISNTTSHWRSHVTGLLSLEFLELVRSRLNPGGILFYGTTGSHRAARTGFAVFPHGVEVRGYNLFLALGEQPIDFDPEQWKNSMRRYRRMGRPMFDPADPAAQARLDRLAAGFDARYVPCDELRRTVANAPLLTDDSMGDEWTQYPLD